MQTDSFTITNSALAEVYAVCAIGGALLAIGIKLWGVGRSIDRLVIEHDLMWIDYCKRHHIPAAFIRNSQTTRTMSLVDPKHVQEGGLE